MSSQTGPLELVRSQGGHRAALPCFRQAVELAPDDTEKRLHLAWCLLSLGELDEGREHARRAGDWKAGPANWVRLTSAVFLYLLGLPEERQSTLRDVTSQVSWGVTAPDWELFALVEQGLRAGHPELRWWLGALSRVVTGQATPAEAELRAWPAWAEAEPDAAPLWSLWKLAETVGRDALFETARAENLQLTSRAPPYTSVPFESFYASPEALLRAVALGNTSVAEVALHALERVDRERLVDVAMGLVSSERLTLHWNAGLALARSHEDRALTALLRTLEPGSKLSHFILAESVHPAVTERLRAVLREGKLDDFTPRPRPNVLAWRMMPAEEQQRLAALSPEGPRPLPALRAQRALEVLGRRGDVESLDLMVRVFEGHPDDELRATAAYALTMFDDPRAHAALDSAWADAHDGVRHMAVEASLARDPKGAWSRFERHLEAVLNDTGTADDTMVVAEVLNILRGRWAPRGVAPERDPLLIEPRFYELAARVRRRPFLDHFARRVLELLPRDELDALLARFPLATEKAPRKPRVRMPKRRDFVARYQAGEYAVWEELIKHTAAVNKHPDLYDEAMAVARLLMKRVRYNTDRVRETLIGAGAILADESAPAKKRDLKPIERALGRLPISLHAFWSVVGTIDLAPPYEKEGPDYGECSLEDEGISLIALDPLEIDGWEVDDRLDEYLADRAETHDEFALPFFVDIAPDYLGKQHISGGPALCIELSPDDPDVQVDTWVLEADPGALLVEYLRTSFAHGGFPMLEVARKPKKKIGLNERVAFRNVKGSWSAAADRLREKLCRGLIPF